MSEVHVVAIITPVPGKEARVREIILELANYVQANEKDVAKYHAFEQYDGEGGNVFVMEELYKDKATLDTHMDTEYFHGVGKKIGSEGLLAKPLDIKLIKPIGGFASR